MLPRDIQIEMCGPTTLLSERRLVPRHLWRVPFGSDGFRQIVFFSPEVGNFYDFGVGSRSADHREDKKLYEVIVRRNLYYTRCMAELEFLHRYDDPPTYQEKLHYSRALLMDIDFTLKRDIFSHADDQTDLPIETMQIRYLIDLPLYKFFDENYHNVYPDPVIAADLIALI